MTTPDFETRLEQIALRYCLAEIYAFGSRAREVAARLRGEEATVDYPQSDVDVGVRTKPGAMLDAPGRVQISLEMEDMLGVPRVDLVVLREADPFLALEIIRGELLYAENLDRQSAYELYILRRAGDLIPFQKERIRMIIEEGAR